MRSTPSSRASSPSSGSQAVAAVQFVGAIGADDGDVGVDHGACQVADEIQCRAVRPVQVLKREHDGSVGGAQVVEDALQCGEHLRGREVRRVVGRGDHVRDEPCEPASRTDHHGTEAVLAHVGRELTEGFGHRCQRQ
jgi:hypothetical protein